MNIQNRKSKFNFVLYVVVFVSSFAATPSYAKKPDPVLTALQSDVAQLKQLVFEQQSTINELKEHVFGEHSHYVVSGSFESLRTLVESRGLKFVIAVKTTSEAIDHYYNVITSCLSELDRNHPGARLRPVGMSFQDLWNNNMYRYDDYTEGYLMMYTSFTAQACYNFFVTQGIAQ